MVPGSYECRSPCVNPLTNSIKEQNELAGGQGPAGISDASNDKASNPSEALILPLVFFPVEDLLTIFIKVLIETSQA